MGGAGSGGHKKSAGDTETHSAWLLTAPVPNDPNAPANPSDNNPNNTNNPRSTAHKLPQATCKFCSKEMAQHTSRQRSHLLVCTLYLEAMRDMGVENSITRQAADPGGFAREQQQQQNAGARNSDAGLGPGSKRGKGLAKEGEGGGGGAARKPRGGPRKGRKTGESMQQQQQQQQQNEMDVSMADSTADADADPTDPTNPEPTLTLALFQFATKIQALALAEAGVPEDEVRRCTGIDARLLGDLRRRARERGFDPLKSTVMVDVFVLEDGERGPDGGYGHPNGHRNGNGEGGWHANGHGQMNVGG